MFEMLVLIVLLAIMVSYLASGTIEEKGKINTDTSEDRRARVKVALILGVMGMLPFIIVGLLFSL